MSVRVFPPQRALVAVIVLLDPRSSLRKHLMPTPALLAQAQALVQAQALTLAQASEATTVAEAQRDKAVQGGRMLAASLAAATDKNAALQSKNDALHTKVAALQALLEQERASGAASKR